MKTADVLTTAMVVSLAPNLVWAGLSNPYTESFDAGAANWLGGDFLPAGEVASGGVGDSGYITAQTGFEFNDPDSFNIVFRGNTGLFPGTDASEGNFFGNWIAGGVTELSFSIRHNISEPVTIITRIAHDSMGAPFPGAVALTFAPVLPGEWTEIRIAIDPNNPSFVSFENSTFQDVFSDVGFIQIGVAAPAGLLGDPGVFDFGLDNVRIVPAPAGGGLLGVFGLALSRRRRG